jgi:hypothetical protein
MMEGLGSSETLVHMHWTARCYIPEDGGIVLLMFATDVTTVIRVERCARMWYVRFFDFA